MSSTTARSLTVIHRTTGVKRELASADVVPEAKRPKPSSVPQTTLMWFRTDMRIQDNTALSRASLAAKSSGNILVGLFIVSPDEWKNHNLAPIKINFWMRSLRVLQNSLKALGIPLLVANVEKQWSVPTVVSQIAQEINAEEVFWNIEYEVNELKRDEMVKNLLGKAGIKTWEWHDQCIVRPGECKTKEGRTYTVFSPFKKCWYRYIYENKDTIELSIPPSDQSATPIPKWLEDIINSHCEIPTTVPGFECSNPNEDLWKAGEPAAQARLNTFISSRIRKYKTDRDFPNIDGTSTLSPYLAIGCISARECLVRALEVNGKKLDSGNDGVVTWISELCWRDFYRNILVAFPRVCKGKAFKADMDSITWSYDKDAFERWCTGRTGFPIVDAAMRQLNTTGWMHNRLRMIVAMFLSKDLLIDWRLGEQYFMQHQVDGDFASNNGGWQWASSTGTDAQPYFRVFNPALQSEKFDPTGEFIRKYVPEIKGLKGKTIHDTSSVPEKVLVDMGYVKQMVDHKVAREKCIAAFKAKASSSSSKV